MKALPPSNLKGIIIGVLVASASFILKKRRRLYWGALSLMCPWKSWGKKSNWPLPSCSGTSFTYDRALGNLPLSLFFSFPFSLSGEVVLMLSFLSCYSGFTPGTTEVPVEAIEVLVWILGEDYRERGASRDSRFGGDDCRERERSLSSCFGGCGHR